MNTSPSCRTTNASEVLEPPVIDSGLEHSAEAGVLPAELEFYQTYHWSLNPHLTVREAIGHLGEEVERLSIVPSGWKIDEVATNIFLLSCAVLNCVDGQLRGLALRLPSRVERTAIGHGATRFVESISNSPWSQRTVSRWRQQWLSDLNNFLSLIVSPRAIDAKSLADAGHKLTRLGWLLPPKLLTKRLAIPSPFSHLDLTPNDVLRLGNFFVRRFPEREQPVLIVGLRTSGSYFAPLLRALLETEGYSSVDLLTVEPLKGVGRREERELKQFAARGYWALIVDDSPDSSRTFLAASDIVQRAGFAVDSIKFLAPSHPASLTWFKTFPEGSVITLLPEQWHKQELLNSKVVELRLVEYFRSQNFARVSVAATSEFDARMQNTASDERGIRLKRVFEVQLETPKGKKQTKYILAKSVGWGWFGYRAFLMGHRLAGFVPPILGLRDGILYMEWIPQSAVEPANKRKMSLDASAAYVAARVRRLNLSASAADIDFKRYNNGIRVLEKTLSRAYGRFLTDLLMRSRVGGLVRELGCPCPTLVDGNMNSSEWILGPQRPLKTDYEHHGMGKTALNLSDPAYDLADAILNLGLSPEEEHSLVSQYIAASGDTAVERRLFIQKLIAGLWAMSQTQQQLFSSLRGRDAQHDYHLRFMNAWNFLTVQAARHCGSLCHPRTDLNWRAPLVVLDVDGVLDRRLFGFPCTTAAGMEALSLLSAHNFSVALNTARSADEVKEYCKAYSLSGGVAEHGSYLWDAVRQRERVLISAETARQLEELRGRLRNIPGVFLDERHQYSIRAFTYREKPPGLIHSLLSSTRSSGIGDGALAPISTHILHQLLVDLRLDRLTFHHTTIDTTVVAKETDKGTGLVALRDWVLADDAETIAVGDTEHDLAMFRAATRSFAPSNINCRPQARLLGCRIARYPHQRGLLEIVGKIIHSDKARNILAEPLVPRGDDLFMTVLRAADQTWTTNFGNAVFNPAAYRIFMR